MPTSTTTPTGTTEVVDRFLDAVASGAGVPTALYADDAVLDATVPGWRFRTRGAAGIAAEYANWFAAPERFEELERHRIDGGEVVTYLLSWTEAGTPMAAHHSHRLLVGADGRIAADTVFCGGRWDAALLAEMGV